MTYTFKLAKRLARMRPYGFVLLGALACAVGEKVAENPSSTPVSLYVTPNTIAVLASQPIAFHAYGLTEAGDSISVPVNWSASGGTITGGGTFLAPAAGNYLVVATEPEGLADTAMVDVFPTPADSEPSTLVLVPHTASVDVGEPVFFKAWGLTANGDSVDINISWSASGGTISGQGSFHSLSAGVYLVIAAQVGGALADSATVTVSAVPPPPIVSIAISPGSASIETGQSVDFDAWGLTAAGDSVGVSVTWSASGGSITSAGGFTAATAGDYDVTADQVGGPLSGSATVAVTDPPPPPPPPPPGSLVNECATPGAGWIWCDDFDQDRLSSYFEYDSKGGDFVRTNGVGNSGSYGMRARFGPGQVDAGALRLAVGKTPQVYFRAADAGTANYRELFWRFYLKNQAGWTGGGGMKLSRAFGFASTTSWAQNMFGHVWSGGTANNHLTLDPASGTDAAGNLQTTAYNDFPNMRWLGSDPSATPIFDAAHVGQWYCIEAHVKLNSAGQSNGVFELWINGNAEASRTGLNWVGNFSAYGINAVYLENYWGSAGTGSPQQQERYFDNLVVSTQRIGC